MADFGLQPSVLTPKRRVPSRPGRCDRQAARSHRLVERLGIGSGRFVAYDERQPSSISSHVHDAVDALDRSDRRGQTRATVTVLTRQTVDGDPSDFDGHEPPVVLGSMMLSEPANVTDQFHRVGWFSDFREEMVGTWPRYAVPYA